MDAIQEVWKNYCDGDREAFGMLYEQTHPRLTLYILGVTKDEEAAKNIASEALIKLFEYRPPDDIKNPLAWLFKVTKNKAYTSFTKHKRQSELQNEYKSRIERHTVNKGEHALEEEQLVNLMESLLTPDEKAIWKYHTEGYSNEEIAKELNMPEKTVANKKSKARNKLKAALSK